MLPGRRERRSRQRRMMQRDFALDCLKQPSASSRVQPIPAIARFGNFFRKYQTTRAPSPPRTNMARQPNLGMMSVRATPQPQAGDDEDRHETSQFAARLRWYNSLMSNTQPHSRPESESMMNWIKIKTRMEGAKAATMDANRRWQDSTDR